MRLKVVDYDAMRVAFDEQFKKTYQLIQNGETHLDNLAEGFHEADGVIWRLPTIDAVPVVRCSECKYEKKCNKHISTWEIGDDMEHYWADRPIEFCGYGERKE